MRLRCGNLLRALPDASQAERIESLVDEPGIRIERIVSHGQNSPAEFWYDQSQPEWVMILRGSATLRLEGEGEPLVLEPGDWVDIPAHRRHRVEWTDPTTDTIWLAVFRTDGHSI